MSKKWKAICVGGDPQHENTTYFISRWIYKLAQIVARKTKGRFMTDYAAARASYYLIREAKKHLADLYIGHNLGALPAVINAAKANNKPSGFDAEDFHRHEITNDVNNVDVIIKSKLEDKYFPHLDYLTTSSPQIANAYLQIYPALKPVVLLNVFPKSNLNQPTHNLTDVLKLLWFSQTIGANRGLTDIVKALRFLENKKIELHLLGSTQYADAAFLNELTNSGINIHFHDPIHPDQLNEFVAKFDIGLALEPGFSINNNLALSNKIFTYMQAGLAIIATDTTAQKDFISKNPTIGNIYPIGDFKALAEILLKYHRDRNLLINTKTESLRLAHQQYNWEAESLKFLEIVEHTLHK